MKTLLFLVLSSIYTVSAFSQVSKNCTFKYEDTFQADSIIREELSRDGKYIYVEMDTQLVLPESMPKYYGTWNGNIIMIKNLDGSIAEIEGEEISQRIDGNKVILKTRGFPSNEINKSVVVIDSESVIKKVKYDQKILNSYFDLLPFTTKNKINCNF